MKRYAQLLFLALLLSGCLGPNHLGNKYKNWVARVEPDLLANTIYLVGLPIQHVLFAIDLAVLNPVGYWRSKDVLSDPGPFPRFHCTDDCTCHSLTRQEPRAY